MMHIASHQLDSLFRRAHSLDRGNPANVTAGSYRSTL